MPEVRLSAPVDAQYFATHFPGEGEAPAGAFTFYVDRDGATRGMIYSCPCGCGRHGALGFHPKTEDDVKYNRAAWQWDGSRERPTLSPSVNHVGHWHGWLRAGKWEQA